jgi:hypothetical protein
MSATALDSTIRGREILLHVERDSIEIGAFKIACNEIKVHAGANLSLDSLACLQLLAPSRW